MNVTGILTVFWVMIFAQFFASCDMGNGSGGSGVAESAPGFSGIRSEGDRVIVLFDRELSDKVDASKVLVSQGNRVLARGADFSLITDGDKLVITFKSVPSPGRRYKVGLGTGAVRSAEGHLSQAMVNVAEVVIDGEPAMVGRILFRQYSNTVILVRFNQELKGIDEDIIKLEIRDKDGEEFSEVSGVSMALDADDGTVLLLTLETGAEAGTVHRVLVGIGGVRVGSDVFNNRALSSLELLYSESPELDLGNPPYILDNRLVATFDRDIVLRNDRESKVKVFKSGGDSPPEEDDEAATDSSEGVLVVPVSVPAVNSLDRSRLEIDLPAVLEGETYRLELDEGAVGEYGVPDNLNKAIRPNDLMMTMGAAPVLDSYVPPYIVGNTISVTFDREIKILDADSIRLRTKSSSSEEFRELGLMTEPVVSSRDGRRMEIVLDSSPSNDEVYRVAMDAGAVGGVNVPVSGGIAPEDRDVTVSNGPELSTYYTVVENERTLSVLWPEDVRIIDAAGIWAGYSLGWSDFTRISRVAEIDRDNARKVNVTMDEVPELYKHKLIVTFEVGSVLSVADNNGNRRKWTSERVRFRISDTHGWKEVPPAAGRSKWSPRNWHTSVVFKNRIWVMGGHTNDGIVNDIWSSPDGARWEKVGDAPWAARYSHSSLTFQDRIWVIGGRVDGYKKLKDVWSSKDGLSWVEESARGGASVGWRARGDHSSVVFQDKMWVMGGVGVSYMNDVWSSEDGIVWKKEVRWAPWEERYRHANVVSVDGARVWVIGGLTDSSRIANDAWSSSDGKGDWKRERGSLYYDHSSVVFRDRIWIFGGFHNLNVRNNRILSGTGLPGRRWHVEKGVPWTPRSGSSSVVFQDKIWLMGGVTGRASLNDVWQFRKLEVN